MNQSCHKSKNQTMRLERDVAVPFMIFVGLMGVGMGMVIVGGSFAAWTGWRLACAPASNSSSRAVNGEVFYASMTVVYSSFGVMVVAGFFAACTVC